MAEIKPVLQFDSVKAMREEINRLKIAIGEAAQSGEDCSESIERLNDVNKVLNSTLAKSKGENDAVSNSIAGMEQQYKALQNTLRVLSEDQKNSGLGKELVKQASEISEQLNNAKKDIGDYKNNIGRYADGVEEAFEKMGISVKGLTGPMQLAGKGASGLGKALKALFANPWALAIAAIVAILKKLVDAFKNNSSAMEKLKKAMEPLQPIMNAFNNVLGLVADALATVVGWISEKLAGAFEWLLGAIPKIVNGVIDGLNFIITPAKYFYSWVIGALEGIFKLLDKIPGIKLDGVVDALDNAKNAVRDFKIDHINADLTTLTKKTDDVTESVEKNTEAQKENTKAVEEREKAIEELKKRLDADTKSELEKLEEQYKKERELIKGNIEYEKKLREEYEGNIDKIKAKNQKIFFDNLISNAEFSAKEFEKEGTSGYLQILISQLRQAKKEWNDISLIEAKVFKDANTGEAIATLNPRYRGTDEYDENIPDEEVYDRISRSLLGIPFAALENPGDYIELANVFNDFQRNLSSLQKQLIETTGDEQIAIIDQKIAQLTHNAEIANKSLEKSKDKANSDITNKEGLTWWGVVGTDATGQQIQNERDFQDESYNNLVRYLQSCIEAYGVELVEFKGTEEQKTQMFTEQTALRTQLMELELQHEIDINNRRIEDNKRAVEETKKGMQGLANILDNAGGAWETLLNVQIDTGKKSKDELKGQFKVVRGIQSASAMVNALLSANEAYSSLASIPYVGPALGAVAAAAALASGIANVVAINKQDESGADTGSGSTPSVMSPSLIESTPYEYVRNLQTVEEEDELNKPIYVRVTDIEAGLEQSRVRMAESSF